MKKKAIIISGIIILILIILKVSFLYKPMPVEASGVIDNARYLEDPSLCDKLDNIDNKNHCLAVVQKDKSFCEEIQDQEIQDRCYSQLPYSLETCGAVQDNDIRGTCLLNFALTTLNSSVCEIIPEMEGERRSRKDSNVFVKEPNYYRDNCFLGIRLETNDTSLCDNIVEGYLVDYCISPPEDEMIDITKLLQE